MYHLNPILNMIRKSLFIGALLALAAHARAHAQTVHMAGVWEGKYTSNHATEGTLRVTIAHDSVVSATMEFGGSVTVPPSAFKTITHEGERVTWKQDLLGAACDGTGTVSGEKFKGEIRCGPALISFEVRKK
jgi:hypothetical protein